MVTFMRCPLGEALAPKTEYAQIVIKSTVLGLAATASFSLTNNGVFVHVDVTPSPPGLSVTVDGTSYTSPHTFGWIVGSSHTIATTSTQAGAEATRYAWYRWSTAAPFRIASPSRLPQ